MQTPQSASKQGKSPESPSEDHADDSTTLASLHLVRDEVRLQIHLAGMEAKEKWHEMEGQLEAVAKRLQHKGDNAAKLIDDTRENARGALEDLKVRVELFRESIKDATGH